MSEVKRIADQLRRAFAGEAWHGPSVLKLLEGVTAEQAGQHPIAGAHSIWELVQHIGAWEGAGVRRLNGDRAELPDEEDWASTGKTDEEAWEQTKAALKTGHQRLLEAILQLDDERLKEPIMEGMPSVYFTLHGIIQHDLYHAGQIAILKKAVRGE
jgi:uncharacterized damage-inducible protein DinB